MQQACGQVHNTEYSTFHYNYTEVMVLDYELCTSTIILCMKFQEQQWQFCEWLLSEMLIS